MTTTQHEQVSPAAAADDVELDRVDAVDQVGAVDDADNGGAATRVLDIASALARFGLAIMWIYSGWTKIGVHMDVTKSIEAYEIFTPYWSELLARIIGPVEIAGGLLLLLGIKLKPAGWVSIGVLVLFIIGLYSAYSRGLNIDCGCFGPQPEGDGSELLRVIARDVVFIAVTLFMIYRPYTKFALYP